MNSSRWPNALTPSLAVRGIRHGLETACEGGTRLAHITTTAQTAWCGSVSVDSDGADSGRTCDVLGEHRGKWSKIWGAGGSAGDSDIDWRSLALPQLHPIEAAGLRKASASFPAFTAVVDGWHPRHFSLLSDACLMALAGILEMIEGLGEFPRVTQDMLVALLPKDDGGLRPIGLYRALFRLWARMRRSEWKSRRRDPSVRIWSWKVCDGCGVASVSPQ